MWQVTLLRVLLIIFIGIVSFITLLYVVGLRSMYRLKRRKKQIVETTKTKRIILRIYLLALTGIILVGFLIIKLYIRGIL